MQVVVPGCNGNSLSRSLEAEVLTVSLLFLDLASKLSPRNQEALLGSLKSGLLTWLLQSTLRRFTQNSIVVYQALQNSQVVNDFSNRLPGVDMFQQGLPRPECFDTSHAMRMFIYVTVIPCSLLCALHSSTSAGSVLQLAGSSGDAGEGKFDGVGQQIPILVIFALLVRKERWSESFSVFCPCHARVAVGFEGLLQDETQRTTWCATSSTHPLLLTFSVRLSGMSSPLSGTNCLTLCPTGVFFFSFFLLQQNRVMVISTWFTSL